jgi:hypothetical protein
VQQADAAAQKAKAGAEEAKAGVKGLIDQIEEAKAASRPWSPRRREAAEPAVARAGTSAPATPPY